MPDVIFDATKTSLYRTSGERAIRTYTPNHAAFAFAARMARREHGRRATARVVPTGYSDNGEARHYRASLTAANGYRTTVEFVLRRA